MLRAIIPMGMLLISAQASAANLVINGDFENTAAAFIGPSSANGGAGDFFTIHTLGPILGGSWTQASLASNSGASILVRGDSATIPDVQVPPGPSSGQQWLYLTQGGVSGSKVSQNLTLAAGTYDLGFDISGWAVGVNGGGSGIPTVTVELTDGVNSVLLEDFSGTNLIWTHFTRAVNVGSTGNYVLSFLVTGPRTNNYATLDNVTLSSTAPVPVPSPLSLLGSALLVSAAVSGRKKKHS